MFSTSADSFLRQPSNFFFVLNADDHVGFLVGFLMFEFVVCFFAFFKYASIYI